MIQETNEIFLETKGQKLFNITNLIENVIKLSKLNTGLINISILHTSASLLIQENADSNVQKDLLNFFDKIAPMKENLYIHNDEGKDDMPAHIKSALTQTNLSLSFQNKQLKLGTWQGIYLFEHRINPQKRTVLVHLIGE
tara:strand:- start:15424 stop:15843 length:420 start_codon:yes stop_codon:yes gene_type:complete